MAGEPAANRIVSLQAKMRAAARALQADSEQARLGGLARAGGRADGRPGVDGARQAEEPLFEVKTSAIGGDVDRAGSRLLVYADRVALIDERRRSGGTVSIRELDRMRVRRRLTSVTVELGSVDGKVLELKGVRPSAADELRRLLASLKLELMPLENPSTPTASVLRNLNALAAMGLLTQDELAEKRAILSRQSVGR